MEVPRILMPLLGLVDNAGATVEAVLYQATHRDAPRIKVLKKSHDGKQRVEWMDFSIASALQIEYSDRTIQQVVGDGPQMAELSATQQHDVVQLAMACLPPTAGRFEIVWVPNDGLPF